MTTACSRWAARLLPMGIALIGAVGCANHIDSYHESGKYVVLQTVNPPTGTAKEVEKYVPRFEQLLEFRGFHMGKAEGPNALQLQLVYAASPSEVKISAYLLQNDTIILRAVASNNKLQDSPDKDEMIAHLIDTAVKAFDSQLTEFAPQVAVISDGATGGRRQDQPGQGTSVIEFGTAFATNSPNAYATARHVIAGATKIELHCGPDRVAEATLRAVDQGNDLAVLHSDLKADAFLELAPDGSAQPGDHVFTMGFPTPDLLGVAPKYTDGAISSLTGIGDTKSLMQISVPIQPGNSGGPLVDAKGRVVGVIDSTAAVASFYHNTGVMPQNVNFAVSAYYLYPLVKDIPKTAPGGMAKLPPVTRVTKSLCLVVAQGVE